MHRLDSIKINGKELKNYICTLLVDPKISTVTRFSRFPYKIEFSPEIKEICIEIFESIKQLKKNSANEELAGIAASYLFEAFSKYWVEKILEDRKELVGIQFWREILVITKTWEDVSGTMIHKGTPYFFLAENYLLTGDRDLAFMYLYNAISDDSTWAEFAPSLHYPDKSPAYLTATMTMGSNQMDYLVKQWRENLNKYIQKFNELFHRSFGLADFDSKFLCNKQLSNVVYFFVFNFIYLYEITNYTESKSLQNQFSRLKTLDLIFNLCLIIDETLKKVESISKGKMVESHKISDGITWLCNSNGWMKQEDLETFWNKENLNVANGEPDIVLPRLLSMTEQYKGNPVRKEVFTLLIAYNLRNYGGHNISQQNVLTSKFDEIIEQLLISLFLCLDT
jgi:hypothetical protein